MPDRDGGDASPVRAVPDSPKDRARGDDAQDRRVSRKRGLRSSTPIKGVEPALAAAAEAGGRRSLLALKPPRLVVGSIAPSCSSSSSSGDDHGAKDRASSESSLADFEGDEPSDQLPVASVERVGQEDEERRRKVVRVFVRASNFSNLDRRGD